MAVSVQALSGNFTSISSESCHQPNGTTIILMRKTMTHKPSSHFTERERALGEFREPCIWTPSLSALLTCTLFLLS